jgi:hypothetical protein
MPEAPRNFPFWHMTYRVEFHQRFDKIETVFAAFGMTESVAESETADCCESQCDIFQAHINNANEFHRPSL